MSLEKLTLNILKMYEKDRGVRKVKGVIAQVVDTKGNEHFYYQGRGFPRRRVDSLGMRSEVIESYTFDVLSEGFTISNYAGRIMATCKVGHKIEGTDISYSRISTKNSQKNLGEVCTLPFLVVESICSALHNDIKVYKIGNFKFPVDYINRLDVSARGH